MPRYEDKLTEHLDDLEMARLKKCLRGDKDLMLDFPELYNKLFDYYATYMPYGTAKARDGDPDVWILNEARWELKTIDEKAQLLAKKVAEVLAEKAPEHAKKVHDEVKGGVRPDGETDDKK
jgi:hypothetical protein